MNNKTVKVLMCPTFIKVYFDNLTSEQHRCLDSTLAKAPGQVTLEHDGYIVKAKQETLYKVLYILCNSFSIELI